MATTDPPSAPLGARPLALVMPGGAAYGAWQAGCLYSLVRKGLAFHSIYGTSAGALNGCAYFQDTMELSWKIWRNVKNSDFFRISPRLSPFSVLSQRHLRAFLADHVDEDRARRLRRCWFYVVSTDIASGRTHQATYSPEPGGPWDEPLLDNIVGSISIPFLLPPMRIPGTNGGRDKLLLDGNAKSYVNLYPALERGARDVLYLSVLHPSMMEQPLFGLRDYVGTLINQLLQGQIDHSLESLRGIAEAKGVRAFVFHPSRPLKLSSISFETGPCRDAFDLGVEDAELLMDDPARYQVL
ncbi:MAG: patatin-like phospholipase family protein [Elusimicrobiota bacterium]